MEKKSIVRNGRKGFTITAGGVPQKKFWLNKIDSGSNPPIVIKAAAFDCAGEHDDLTKDVHLFSAVFKPSKLSDLEFQATYFDAFMGRSIRFKLVACQITYEKLIFRFADRRKKRLGWFTFVVARCIPDFSLMLEIQRSGFIIERYNIKVAVDDSGGDYYVEVLKYRGRQKELSIRLGDDYFEVNEF